MRYKLINEVESEFEYLGGTCNKTYKQHFMLNETFHDTNVSSSFDSKFSWECWAIALSADLNIANDYPYKNAIKSISTQNTSAIVIWNTCVYRLILYSMDNDFIFRSQNIFIARHSIIY